MMVNASQDDQRVEESDDQSFTLLGMPAVVVSSGMKNLMDTVRRVARTNAAVLIMGESGSGKELAARAIHEFSPRNGRPWVDVNCAALPDHLLESELFGYERGAFSGADTAKPGMFELANGGTLFLDEIGELELSKQSKLLRVLDGYPYYRLGGTRKIQVDVRVVAATNRDLEAAMNAGKFRPELYYRLNEACLTVPPLRERREAVLPLARMFMARQDPSLVLADAAAAALQEYSWPGNVRELRNMIAKAAVMADGHVIDLKHLSPELQAKQPVVEVREKHSLELLEEQVIFRALSEADGRKDRAAAMLGISRRTLARRLKLYGGRTLAVDSRREVLCN